MIHFLQVRLGASGVRLPAGDVRPRRPASRHLRRRAADVLVLLSSHDEDAAQLPAWRPNGQPLCQHEVLVGLLLLLDP